jgi:hypothetical protein
MDVDTVLRVPACAGSNDPTTRAVHLAEIGLVLVADLLDGGQAALAPRRWCQCGHVR